MEQKERYRRVTAMGALAWSLMIPLAGHAAEGDPAAADGLFREGRRLATDGDYEAACPKFSESYRLDPAPGTLLNLADCEGRTGKIAAAAEHFRRALEVLPSRDERIPIAQRRLTELEARVPRLTITATGPLAQGFKVIRDGIEFGTASLGTALAVEPGEHVVVVRSTGKQDRVYRLFLREGETRELPVHPGADIAPLPGPAKREPAPSEPASIESASSARRPIGYALGAAGLAGLAVFGITGGVLMSKHSFIQTHCPQQQCDSEGRLPLDSTGPLLVANGIGLGVGLAGLTAGAVLLLTGPSNASPATTTVAASSAHGGFSLSIRRSF